MTQTQNFRDLFHMPEGVYALSHSTGCLPKGAMDAVHGQFFTPWQTKGGNAWPQWLGVIDTFCENLAALLGGQAHEYCPQTNLSSGLTKLLTALPQTDHQRVVLMHETAFPSMGYVVEALRQQGFSLRLIPKEQPAEDIATWQAALDEKPDIVLVTHVHSNTGAASPVKEICALSRQHDILTIVDIAQSAGIIPIDLEDWQADIALGSCIKWLCGGPGAGFLWVHPNLLPQMAPQDVGWFSHEDPFEFDIHRFRYAPGAKRFLGGTPSILPFACANKGLELIKHIGVETIFTHNRSLISPFLERRIPGLVKPPNPSHMGGTLCLEFEQDIVERACENLKAANCQFDSRGQTIRLSWHIYNSLDEAELVAHGLHSL